MNSTISDIYDKPSYKYISMAFSNFSNPIINRKYGIHHLLLGLINNIRRHKYITQIWQAIYFYALYEGDLIICKYQNLWNTETLVSVKSISQYLICLEFGMSFDVNDTFKDQLKLISKSIEKEALIS